MGRRLSVTGIFTLVCAIVMHSCSARTIGELKIDIGSFIASNDKSINVTLPSSSGIDVYLLPGIQIDALGTGADVDMSRGTLLTFPAVPAESSLRAELLIELDLRNLHGSASVPPSLLEIVVAAQESNDIYADGIVVGTKTMSQIAPSSLEHTAFRAILSEGEPAFDLLQSGSMRLGVHVRIDPSAGNDIPMHIEINEVICEVEIRLYSFFSLL